MPSSESEKSLLRRFSLSVPVLVTAPSFSWPALPGGDYLPGMDADALARVMQIEWLLMAGGLLYMVPLFVPAESRRGHRIRAVSVVLLSLAFAWGAWDFGGLRGLFAFALLLFVSFGGSTLVASTGLRKNVFGMMVAARRVVCLPVFSRCWCISISAATWVTGTGNPESSASARRSFRCCSCWSSSSCLEFSNG